MRLAMLVVMAAMGASAWAEETSAAQVRSVTVCVNAGFPSADVAQQAHVAEKLASKMFAGIGVSIEWRTDGACTSPDAIKIGYSYQTPESDHPEALAYAHQFGTTIVVFQDRLVRVSQAVRPEQLLAWVLVHEISHILQGIDRHSATGIMKARWTFFDYYDLRCKGPGFTSEDVHLIHLGLAARAYRKAGKEPELVAVW